MIIQNAVTCQICGDFIFSRHRHDYASCQCGNVSVDGGRDYIRRTYIKENSFTEESWEFDTAVYQRCVKAAQQAIDTGRNADGITNAIFRELKEFLS